MKGFFNGSATALITPFTENGVNFEAFGELIEYQVAGGTDALVILGTFMMCLLPKKSLSLCSEGKKRGVIADA